MRFAGAVSGVTPAQRALLREDALQIGLSDLDVAGARQSAACLQRLFPADEIDCRWENLPIHDIEQSRSLQRYP